MDDPAVAVPYARVQIEDPDWLREKFSVDALQDGALKIAGTCRRCGHDVSKRIEREVVRAFESDAEARVMACNCSTVHEGRPSGHGCGAYWGLAVKARG
jgi:hypothetical protein